MKVVWLRTVLHDVIHSFHSPSTRYHWMSSWLCHLLTLNSVLPDRNEGWLSPGVQQRRSVVLLIINQSQSSPVSWIVNLTSISESDWLSAASSVSVLAVSSVTLLRSGWDLNISLLARFSSSSLLLVSASSAWILSSTFPGLWRVTEEPTGGETFGTDWKYWDYNNVATPPAIDLPLLYRLVVFSAEQRSQPASWMLSLSRGLQWSFAWFLVWAAEWLAGTGWD